MAAMQFAEIVALQDGVVELQEGQPLVAVWGIVPKGSGELSHIVRQLAQLSMRSMATVSLTIDEIEAMARALAGGKSPSSSGLPRGSTHKPFETRRSRKTAPFSKKRGDEFQKSPSKINTPPKKSSPLPAPALP